MADDVKKYDFIDALRGLAIIGVVMVHVGHWIPPETRLIAAIAQAGKYGVQLFFVVSAFTLFLSLKSRQQFSQRWVLEFFVRRFFRVAPAFYFAIAFYAFFQGLGSSYWAPNGIDAWKLLLTFTFLHGWHVESINSVVPGGWSIAAEFMFYLTVPMLYLSLKCVRQTTICLLLSIVVAAFLRILLSGAILEHYPASQNYLVNAFLEFWFFTQLPVFLVGILTFHILRSAAQEALPSDITMWCALLTFALALLAHATGIVLLQSLLFSVGFSLLIISLSKSPIYIMVNPVTVFRGRVSFSLYLAHFFVLDSAKSLEFTRHFHGNLGFALGLLVVLTTSATVAFALYRLVELPGINFGKQVVGFVRRR